MNKLPIGDSIRTNSILHDFHLQAKKGLGQNFLTNLMVLQDIVESADVNENDQVIEVGPGIGALTEQIALRAGKVLAFEIDDRLIPVLDETLADYDNVEVINADVLKVNLEKVVYEHFNHDQPIKVIANLPYYITTPIIFRFLDANLDLTSMTVMMQKEVADRIIAGPGGKDFGPLSIGVQATMNASISMLVQPNSFVPAPKVVSAVVNIVKPDKQKYDIAHEDIFNKLVKGSFAQRRKTIYNNLKNTFGKQLTVDEIKKILNTVQITESTRAEQLSIEQFITLSNEIFDANQK